LATIQDCGILHRDLRKANILAFEDGWQIVDFDRACRIDATDRFVKIPSDNPKQVQFGDRVQSLLAAGVLAGESHITFEWTREDDEEMLEANI
jgi:streptomycin 6-kinase